MRNRWLTRRAVLATIAITIWAPGCLVAGWWQATVAMSGNALSYLYAVEWPAFAVLGVVVWWHLVHDDPETVGARGLARLRAAHAAQASPAAASQIGEGHADERRTDQRRTDERHGEECLGDEHLAGDGGSGAEEVDDELRAYNEYLASLADRPKTWLRR